MSGSILPAGDVDEYNFTAAAAGRVSIRIVAHAALDPMCFQLRGPSGPIGSRVCGVAEFSVQAGAHTIAVDGGTAADSGQYGLTLQGLSAGLTCGQPLSCDQTAAEAVECIGETDAHTVTAGTGDVVSLRVAPATTMCYRLFGPSGTQVGAQKCDTGEFTIPGAGVHTVVVSPQTATTTGAYGLTRQDLAGTGPCGREITCGQTTLDEIEILGDVDAYHIEAQSAGGLAVRIAPGTITAPSCFRLFGPAGAAVGSRTCDFAAYNVSAGTHTLLVEPSSSPGTTDYAFSLEGISQGLACGIGLQCGQVVQDQIEVLGDEDAYVFSGAAGDKMRLTVRGTLIVPMCYRFYGPGGAAVGTRQCNTTADVTLGATGLQTVLVEPSGPSITGSYTLELQCLSCADLDADSRCDPSDNCVQIYNPSQWDADQDGHGDACDCAPTDAGSHGLPAEVADLDVSDEVTITWTPVTSAGPGTHYDLVAGSLSLLPVGRGSEECAAWDSVAVTTAWPAIPPAGAGTWFVVRARNACGTGPYGTTSAGAERVTSACP